MPRDNLSISDMTINEGKAFTASAITQANGIVIAAGGETTNLVIYLENTSGSAGATVTISAGNPDLAQVSKAQTVTLAASAKAAIVLESARFIQSDGSVLIDTASGNTVSAAALRLPKGIR